MNTTTMTGPELQARAEALNVNPYYLGYALATGAASIEEARARDGGNYGFCAWNERIWQEQAKAEGVRREIVSILPGAEARHRELIASKVSASQQQVAA